MSAADHWRLKCVQSNRSKRVRTARIGQQARSLVERVLQPGARHAARVADFLASRVDGDFRAHCRIGLVDRGRVVIHVNRHEMVYAMRIRWQAALERELRMLLPLSPGGSVVFRYGCEGEEICEPEKDQ